MSRKREEEYDASMRRKHRYADAADSYTEAPLEDARGAGAQRLRGFEGGAYNPSAPSGGTSPYTGEATPPVTSVGRGLAPGNAGSAAAPTGNANPVGRGLAPAPLTSSANPVGRGLAPGNTGSAGTPTATPTAIPDPYGEAYRTALTDYVNPTPFTWDPAADPAYQAYRKEYAREGRRASEDTLGQYAAMTGGVPSTAAVTAAQQAGDYYAAQMADKVPELYQLAYSMYADADARRLRALEALRSARGDELARWDAELKTLADARDFDYRQSRDEHADALELAKLGAQYGDYGGLAGLGLDTARANGTRYAYGPDGAVYEIGSAKGQSFLDSAQPGQSMRGADGSEWVKNADGSVSIRRGGETWTVAAPAVTGYGYGGRGSGKTDPDAPSDAAADYPIDLASVEALGYGPISTDRLAALVDAGAVEQYLLGGSWHFRRRGDGSADRPKLADALANRSRRLGL